MDYQDICISGATPGVLGGLNLWHGRQHWFYLDTRKINAVPVPLVNIGLGCAISQAEAVTLPFTIFDRPDQLATDEQIAADYSAVSRAAFNLRAQDYENYTICRLTDEGIDVLVKKRFAFCAAALRSIFPEFDTWPEKAKAATLDLMIGVGLQAFFTYYTMILDLKDGNFARAALHCCEDVRVLAFEKRNLARSILFAEAANEI